MNVDSVSKLPFASPSNALRDESADQEYAALIAQFYPAHEYQSRDEINANDRELEKFKDDLSTKGAAVFLKELDEEKIKALVEEYREKLLKEKEKHPEIPMDINKMVSDFKKQLIEEMMEAQKAEKEKQGKEAELLMSSEMLEQIQALRQDEQKSGIAEIGFLEQMLSASNTEAKRKSLEF
jgi:GTPase involved in cell partitioning and DNA repair